MAMLYLSQLTIDGRCREARRDLSDCHALHERVLHAFPDASEITAARDHYGVLYRVESLDGGARILVQSRERPDWTRLPAGYLRESAPEAKRIDGAYARISQGQELVFRLRANPTRRISSRNTGEDARWHGKRVEVRREEDQLAWLRRKGEGAGFQILTVRTATAERSDVPDIRVSEGARQVNGKHKGHDLHFGSVLFEGRLRVTDADAFRRALESGIGSGKAFGFGLLSVAPVP